MKRATVLAVLGLLLSTAFALGQATITAPATIADHKFVDVKIVLDEGYRLTKTAGVTVTPEPGEIRWAADRLSCVFVGAPSTYTITVKWISADDYGSTTATVVIGEGHTPDPTPDPEPAPTPAPDVKSLSAVGLGSLFGIDDALSAASRDHEIGAFLASQNGGWTLIADEAMAAAHPAAFDKWEAVRVAKKKSKPCVIWHDSGRVLGVDEVAGKTRAEILSLAKAKLPTSNSQVVIRGKVHPLGLLQPNGGVRYAGPRVSAILKPLAADKCPSVDLSSQVLYDKDQSGGTCVLNTFAGLCESAIYVCYGRENVIELSPYFLANLCNGYNGTYAATAAELVQKWGNLPFDSVKPYAKNPSDWKTRAAPYKCLAVYGPPESDSPGYLRAALNRGFIAGAGISVGNGFDPDASGYISYARGAGRYINHEIRVTGWDQAKKRFKIANSWSKSWGVNGFAWLDEKFFEADTDMWVVVAMVANDSYKFPEPSLN